MPLRKIHKEQGREFPNGVQSWVIGTNSDQSDDLNDQNVEYVTGTNDTTVSDNKDSDNNDDDNDESDNDVNEQVDTTDDASLRELTDDDETNFRQGRGVMQDIWKLGEQAVDAVAEHAIETENADNGISDKSSIAGKGCGSISFDLEQEMFSILPVIQAKKLSISSVACLFYVLRYINRLLGIKTVQFVV